MTIGLLREFVWSTDARGTALVTTLLVMTLMTALGVSLVAVSSLDARMAANHRMSGVVLYAAEAVVERAVQDLRGAEGWTDRLGGVAASSFRDVTHTPVLPTRARLDLDVLTAALQADSDADGPWGANRPVWRLFSWGPLSALIGGGAGGSPVYVAAWIADDACDMDNDPGADDNGVLMIHGEAYGPGQARRVVEATVARLVPGGPRCGLAPLPDPTDPLGPCHDAGCYDEAGSYWPPGLMPTGTVPAAGGARLLSWREVR
jgi:PilX N-terminal